MIWKDLVFSEFRRTEEDAKERQILKTAFEIAGEIANPLQKAEALRSIAQIQLHSDTEGAKATFLDASNITLKAPWVWPQDPQKYYWVLMVIGVLAFVFKKGIEEKGQVVFNWILSCMFQWSTWILLSLTNLLTGFGDLLRVAWKCRIRWRSGRAKSFQAC